MKRPERIFGNPDTEQIFGAATYKGHRMIYGRPLLTRPQRLLYGLRALLHLDRKGRP